jgi:ABC-type multidrug transport system fused ATPase/permease subunit
MCFVISFAIGLRGVTMQIFTWFAARRLFTDMIRTVANAPVNLYFDVTPIGRILNKFSKDLSTIEMGLAFQLGFFNSVVWQMLQIFIVATAAVPYIAVFLVVIMTVSYMIVSRTAVSIKESVRIQSTTKSPLLSYLGETISGASTIRAFNRQEDFMLGNNKYLNDNILAI